MEGISEATHDIENPCIIPLVTSMSQELDGLPPLSNSCCIYRVPEELRCVNEKAYTPQVVSIGPLHHGKEGLQHMEEHKKRYLRYFLHWTGVSLEDYVKKIKGKEEELRSRYAHTIELCSDEFVRIILVDAAFIIEFLLRFGKHIVPDSNDRIFQKPWLFKFIGPDMILLENQLPFFILEDLFATAKVPDTKPSVFDLSYDYFKNSTNLYKDRGDLKSSSGSKVEHFVDLIRTSSLPTKEERSENQPTKEERSENQPTKEERSENQVEALTMPTMTKLRQAGVKFKARPNENLFDICFKDGILEIPNLTIEDHTEPLLRNLIAFEHCHCSGTHYFTDYISLMDDLVSTPDDVELLVKNGIFESLLGDNNEVSTLINSLGKGVGVLGDEFYYATLQKELSSYHKDQWNKWKADLKRKYFNSPWTTISIIVATLIIILTFIQTACSFTQCAQR